MAKQKTSENKQKMKPKKSDKTIKKQSIKKGTAKKLIAKKSKVKKQKVIPKKGSKKSTTLNPKTVFKTHSTSLKVGMPSPYFDGVDQHGNLVKSTDFLGKTLILYFYPKDDTPGCTAEACSLRDEFKHLSESNYVVIGVSADGQKSHLKFATKYKLPFSLLADTNRSIINAYDVWGSKQFMGRIYDGIIRTTFVIDVDGIIQSIITKVDNEKHAQQILSL